MLRGARRLGAAGLPLALCACSEAPMAYWHTSGPAADPVTRLEWGLTLICVLVVIVISILLLRGILRGRTRTAYDAHRIGRTGNGLSWIYVGAGVSTLVLFGIVFWTLLTLKAIAHPPVDTTLTIEIRAHQWWWEARYLADVPSRTFTTANELHIPVGRPVSLHLIGDDVIHSFWIPALAGKTDVIPGQVNEAWIQADTPGLYRGQCTEFCGAQHAHMAAFVQADSPQAFQQWWTGQLATARPPQTEPSIAGETVFLSRCAACHAVRGTTAGGILGPDLTHVMSRRTLGAGTIANTADLLSHWIANAQDFKPGSRMPPIELAAPELAAVTAYVQTLN